MLDAGDQHAGGAAGGGQFALRGGFLEELVGAVAACFGVGQDRGEGRPAGVGDYTFGVVGYGGPDVVGEGAAFVIPGLPDGEVIEYGGKSVIGGGLKILDSLARGVGLVSVVLRLVPTGGDDRGPDDRSEQRGQGTAVRTSGAVGDVAGSRTERGGGPVLCPDLGALGPAEGRCRGAELGAESAGGLLSGGFDQFAECGDVGLGAAIVGERVGQDGEGVDGLVPGGGGAIAAGGGVFLGRAGLQPGPQFRQSEVRGDLPAGVEDLFVVLVEVAGAASRVAKEVAGGASPGRISTPSTSR